MINNVIDFEGKKAFIRKHIEEFNEQIEDFPGIIKKKNAMTDRHCNIKILKDGKIKKLPLIAYAVDNEGVFFCVTMSGEKTGFHKHQVVV